MMQESMQETKFRNIQAWKMTKLHWLGLAIALVGATYAAYWGGMSRQAKKLEQTPAGSIAGERIAEEHPHLDRAFRYLGFRPDEDDYAQMQQHPGGYVVRHMVRHGWIGVALAFLGMGIATFRAESTRQRMVHSAAMACMGIAMGLIAYNHPIVWFWNGK